MNKRDIVIGVVILALLAGVIYWRQSTRKEEVIAPETLSVEDRIEDKFNFDIPDDVEKAELKDTKGGTSSGIATRKYENQSFELTVLADLPDSDGTYYQVWLEKGSEDIGDYELKSLGTLSVAKGGYMLNYQSGVDFSSFSKVLVSKELNYDSTPEEIVLEGSF